MGCGYYAVFEVAIILSDRRIGCASGRGDLERSIAEKQWRDGASSSSICTMIFIMALTQEA
jgi:hypothetical protein